MFGVCPMGSDLIKTLKDLDDEVSELCRALQRGLFIPSATYVEKTKARIKELKDRVAEVESRMSGEDLGENRFLGAWTNHLLELLESLDIEIDESLRHPSKFIRALGFKIHRILFDVGAPLNEKLDKIAELASKMSEFYGALVEVTRKARDDRIRRAIVAAEGLVKYLRRVIEDILKNVEAQQTADRCKYFLIARHLSDIGFHMSNYIIEAGSFIGKDREVLEDIPYEVYVEKRYGLPLSWVARWYEEELKRAIERFESMARKVDPAKPPLETLREVIHSPYVTPEDMFNDMREFLRIAKARVRDYLYFPEWVECQVTGIREFEKDVYPMGYAATSDPLEGKLECKVVLNQFNYRAYSRGWLMMMAIHEAYYGHNIFAIKIALTDLPKSFKVSNSLGVPLNEGLAHRGEELLQHIYGDSGFPLLVAWRRVHTALRVYIEMEMHYHRRIGPEDAVRLYMDVMGFDEQTARGLVEWHLENRGYNLCYLAGYKMIETLRGLLKGLNEGEFSELLFTAGFVSMKTLKKLLSIREKLPWE